jgi:hypothetical protein
MREHGKGKENSRKEREGTWTCPGLSQGRKTQSHKILWQQAPGWE